MTVATEGGHWYSIDGTPVYEVPNASKPGEMRPTTLRDARKLNLVPSVTGIIACADKSGLRRYFDRQMWEATITTPRIEGMTDDEHFEACRQWARQHSLIARNNGTAIHSAIEQHLQGLPPADDSLWPFVKCGAQAIAELGLSGWHAEKSFADPLGFGGKVDLHGKGFVLDFKTKKGWTDADVKRGLAYDEHGMQLAAYAHGLGLELPVRLINVFIATEEPKYHIHEWPVADHHRLWNQFACLLSYWKLSNL